MAGELQEYDGMTINFRDEQQKFYSQLLYYSRMRGYKDGWVAHKYKEKFNVWPRGLQQIAVPPEQKTVRWIQSRNIAWAKARTL